MIDDFRLDKTNERGVSRRTINRKSKINKFSTKKLVTCNLQLVTFATGEKRLSI